MKLNHASKFLHSALTASRTRNREETLVKIQQLQEKYHFTIQELLDKATWSDADPLSSYLSSLIFEIKKTTSAYRKYKKVQLSARKNSQTNDIPRVTFDNSGYQTHTDQYLATKSFSASAEYGSYGNVFANNAAPNSLLEDSKAILPTAKLSQQLTTCCTYQVPSTLTMPCLVLPLRVSIPLPQQPMAHFHSIFLIRRPKFATQDTATVLYTSKSWYSATNVHLNVYWFSEIGSQTTGNKMWWISIKLVKVVQCILSKKWPFSNVLWRKNNSFAILFGWRSIRFD